MLTQTIEFLAQRRGTGQDQISADSHLVLDLGISSFELVEMCAELEDELDVTLSSESIAGLETVQDVAECLAEARLQAAGSGDR